MTGTRHHAFPVSKRFEYIDTLGAGSMGVVFRARDREMERDVALKTLIDVEATTLFALKREFRALANLTHPNVAQLYHLEISDVASFFTMEWIDGGDLRARFQGTQDWSAMRRGFAGLLQGLHALHTAGKLHRDVKPQNVLVDRDDRVVLVDFGLVLGMSHLSVASQQGGFAGTLAYSAPEQVWGQPIGPSADIYSVGVMLYECLTGRGPFGDASLGSFLGRRERTPTAARLIRPSVPVDLEALAMDLLAYEPADRPSAERALARLLGTAAIVEAPSVRRHRPFVGREQELVRLREAFRESRMGRCVVVLIEGSSGIGKTRLAETFATEIEVDCDAVVLRSRCHPQQTVRFEAVDALVDDLSRFLLQEGEKAQSYLPTSVRPLVRVFPVLDRAELELPAEPALRDADPSELRRRAFQSLRELLKRVALRRPLVLAIEDLQWGDPDSGQFLSDTLFGPDAPALLLIATVRSEDREASPLVRSLEEAGGPRLEKIELGPLPFREARELVDQLVRSGGREVAAEEEKLVHEASGSPFILLELARRLSQTTRAAGPVDLPSILLDRIGALPEDAKAIVEVVATSRGPIDLRTALRVAGSDARSIPRVYELCSRTLLRAAASGADIDVYHDRIREAVLGRLSPDVRAQRHLALAQGLAATEGAPAIAILDQFLAAGALERAADYACPAADEAAQALAFDRAAELYQIAYELAHADPRSFELLERKAEALAAAGRGADAAPSFTSAATAASAGGEPPSKVATLRVRAAAQHFYSGALEKGTDELHAVLDELDIPLPATPGRAILSTGFSFARFLLRGTRLRPKAAVEVDPQELQRLDALQGVARGTSMLDHTLSGAIAAKTLLAALDLGERSRALRALALQAGMEASLGGAWLRRRSLRLLDRADTLAAETGDPYDAAWMALSRGAVAWFHGCWADCVEYGDQAVQLLRAGCLGTTWEIAAIHSFTASALAQQGALRRLTSWLPTQIEDARLRNDAYANAVYRTGDSVFTSLAADDPTTAMRDMDQAGVPWDGGRFHSLHFQHLMGSSYALLYRGESLQAAERIEAAWPALTQAGLVRLDCIGNGLRHLRGRAAIAAAARLDAGSPDRARWIGVAAKEARQTARSTLAHNAANAAALRAGVASLRGNRDAARRELETAFKAYGDVGMQLYAEAARWHLGRLLGGDQGAAQVRAAEEWLCGQDVVRAEAMVAMAIPFVGA